MLSTRQSNQKRDSAMLIAIFLIGVVVYVIGAAAHLPYLIGFIGGVFVGSAITIGSLRRLMKG